MTRALRLIFFGLILMVAAGSAAHAQNISTVAGGGATFVGTATSLPVGYPTAITPPDSLGNYYVATSANARVLKISSTGQMSLFAGAGSAPVGGGNGDGGLAVNAVFGFITGLAEDKNQNIYISDSTNGVIREVNASTGIITTVAGHTCTGTCAVGDGGPATSAYLNQPAGVAVDANGNIYIADASNDLVRVVNTQSTSVTIANVVIAAHTIQTVAGDPTCTGLGDGGQATRACVVDPYGLALDSSGDIFISNASTSVREVKTTGIISTVAGGTTSGYSGDGAAATSAKLSSPYGIAVDASGNLFIADGSNNVIREVTKNNGFIFTVAGLSGVGTAGFTGDGGAATSAELNDARAVAVDSADNVYIADDSNNRIRKVTNTAGIVNHVTGNIATVAGNGWPDYNGDGGLATSTDLDHASGVAVDLLGNIYIADQANQAVRKVTAGTGIITTLAGNGMFGNAASGSAALTAALCDPQGVSVDSSGNVYVGNSYDEDVLEISGGIISRFAGQGFPAQFICLGVGSFGGDGSLAVNASLNFPSNTAIDASKNIFIADTGNNRIRRVDGVTGDISTVAGNGTAGFSGDGTAATGAELNSPYGVAIDSTGNLLLIADTVNNRVREVNLTTGIITTIAGNGTFGYNGEGTATNAELEEPWDVAIDALGNVFIADTYNNRIREVVGGVISTVVGTGSYGYNGDGIPANTAWLANPQGVFVDAFDNLYIADFANSRIRMVPFTPPTTSTVVVSSQTPSAAGQSVMFTATVSSAGGTPTGSVSFYDASAGATCSALGGSTQIGATQALSGGSAQVSTSALGIGAHTILACYLPSGFFGSSSGTTPQTVNQATQTITITQDAPATAAYNTSFTVTATGGGSGQSITFSLVNGSVCSITGTTATSATVLMTSGTGTCQLTLNQAGNGSYSAANPVNSAQTTAQKAAEATLTVTGPLTVTYGSTGTATASGGSGTGTLSFSVGASTGCSVTGNTVSVSNASGTCSLTATMAADGNFNTLTSAPFAVSLGKAAQAALSVTGPASVTYGTTGTATVTGGSGTGTLSFSVGASTGCSVTGTTVSVTNASGTCSLIATMAADNNYNAISSTPAFTVTLLKATQAALTVTGPGSVTYGTTGTAAATGGSGTGSLSFSVGASTGCSVTGTTVGVTNASGTCSLVATMAADNNYNAISSTPAFTVTLLKATQAALTVTGPGSVTYGTTGTASATGGSGSGTLSFSVGASTGCSVTGTTVGVTNASGTCALTATMAADNNYNAITGTSAFTVTLLKGTQAALTVTGPVSVAYGTTAPATVSGGSGTGALSFSVGASTGCSVTGATVGVTNASGTCSLTATMAADNNYNASSSTPAFTVTLLKGTQAALTVTGPGSVTYGTTGTAAATGGSGTGALSFSVGASTGCSVTGTTVSVTNASGTCSLVATMAADNNYNAISSTPAFTVTLVKGTQAALTVTGPASVTYGTNGTATATGGNGTGALSFSVGASTGCSVTGTTVGVTNASGTCSLVATMAGDNNYSAISSTPAFTVTLVKGTQTALTVTGPVSVTYGTSATATATGGNGTGTLAFSAGASTGCSVLGTTVSVTNAGGTCSLTATMGADNNYGAVSSNSPFPVALGKASLSVTPDGGKSKAFGTTFTAFTGVVGGLVSPDAVTVTYQSAGAASGATVGSYNITVGSVNFTTGTTANYNITTNTAVNGLTVTPSNASQIAFISAPFTLTAGQCSNAISIASEDFAGNISNVSGSTPVALGSSSGAGTFYSDNACTISIAGEAISAGTNTITFYYKDTKSGTPTITATSGLTSPTQLETITPAVASQLAITTSPFSILAGQCSGTASVSSQDIYGNASNVTGSTQLDLTSASVGGKFSSDAACQTPIVPVGGKTFVTIPSGSNSASFSYADTVPSTLAIPTTTLTVTDNNSGAGSLGNATQAETILHLAFTTPSFFVAQSQCSGAITVTSEDINNHPAPLTLAAILGLTSTSGGGTFYSDTACTTAIAPSGLPLASDVTVGTGVSAVSFSYKDTAAGTPTLTATIGGYSVAQQESTGSALGFTSASSATFTVAANGTFTVTTSGSPTPALSESGSLPMGVGLLDNGDGTATLSGIPALGTVNSYSVTIKASNGVSPDVFQGFTLTVQKANQSALTVTGPSSVTYGATGTATVTGGSGTGALSFSAGASTGCSVSGTTVSVTNASGTCSLTATMAGDNNYNAISSTPAFVVSLTKANQSVLTVTGPSSVTYGSTGTATTTGGSGTGALSFSVGASTGCSVSGTTVSVTNASGTCSLIATMAADNNYNAISSTPAFVVSLAKANQAALTVTGPSSVTYGSTGTATATGGSGTGTLSFSAGASTGCSVSGTTVSVTNASGTCSLTATMAGDNNYNAISSTPAFAVTLLKGSGSTLTVTGPVSVTYGATGTATATGGSGTGALSFSAGASTGCSVTGTTVSVTNASGSCSLIATMAADGNYGITNSAPFAVSLLKANQSALSVSGPASVTYGTTGTATATGGSGTGALSFSAGASTGCSVTGNTIGVTNVSGTCSLTATMAADNNYNAISSSAAFAVSLLKANQAALAVTGPSSVTYGTTGTATATGGSGTGTISFSAGASTGCSVTGTTVSVTNVSGTCSLTATKAADNNYNSASTAAAFTVALVPATPVITFGAAPAATYPGNFTVSATTNSNGALSYGFVSGQCTFTSGSTFATTAAGSCTVKASTLATSNYLAGSAQQVVTITSAGKTAPTITWPTPAAITYGTPLGGAQLDATANVPGTFVYTPKSGTVLTAGSQTLSVTFTPTNTSSYTTVTSSVTLKVNQATPVILWIPVPVIYGTPLGPLQQDAFAFARDSITLVPGTFAYTPAAGTVLGAGAQQLSATFTPKDTVDYLPTTVQSILIVAKALPKITWGQPASVVTGTALSSKQLDATASVPGTFKYTPGTGTVVKTGTTSLVVTFTPTDSADYLPNVAQVSLTVTAH